MGRGEGGAFRVGVIVVAYNAETTLQQVLDRIPTDLWQRLSGVWVSDDESTDRTHEVALSWQERNPHWPVTVTRQHRNLGYGGNQKAGYRWAIANDLDAVVLLHGDAQYAPELLPELLRPIEDGTAEVVLGSRMLDRGGARRGGMPLYKYVGNRVLTAFQNRMASLSLSEWHSGYRAYSVDALRRVAFESNTDGFDFDTELLLQLLSAGGRVVEVPIPTYYGGEICYVNGMAYARDVVVDMFAWRLGQLGFGSGRLASVGDEYPLREARSSHRAILDRLSSEPPGTRVLDLGCSTGELGAALRERGHRVVGIDNEERPGARERLERFVVADLNRGLPAGISGPFDVIVAADVLEHLADARPLLADVRRLASDRTRLIVTVPNVANWYPRVRIALGLFDYDQRGIFDATHLRFFTRRMVRRMLASAGFHIERETPLGVPLDLVGGYLRRGANALERAGLSVRPTLFAYQFLVECSAPPPVAEPTLTPPRVVPAPS